MTANLKHGLLRLGPEILLKILLASLVLPSSMYFLPTLHAQGEQEPTYQGKTMNYWIEEYDMRRQNLSSDWFLPFTKEQTNAVLFMKGSGRV